MVAEVVDAVVGGDTHKHTHTLEMLSPIGARLAGLQIGNEEAGFAAAVAWIVEHSPGRRVIVGLEGTRSYGIGLARALQQAGLTVVEVERPKREQRRGRGKSDPIDAHLAAVQVLGMNADRLPIPRADGDREALRILLVGRRELSDTQTRRKNQLKALLHTGDQLERSMSSGHLSQTRLTTIIRRRGTATETRLQAIRREEARRLAQAISKPNDSSPATTNNCASSLHRSPRTCSPNAASARSAPRKRSSPGPTRAAAAPRLPSPSSPARPRSQPAAARSSANA
jgi:transposase